MNIHERIKARRKELGLSAEDVADQLGVSRATVYRYESAEITNMGIDKLEPLAKILQATPEYHMGWTDDPTDYEDPDFLNDIPLDLLHEWQSQGLSGVGLTKKYLEYQMANDLEAECKKLFEGSNIAKTSDEYDLLLKYRALDDHGKKMVKCVLELEIQRFDEELRKEIIEADPPD